MDLDGGRLPAEFVAFDLDVLERDVTAFPEEFDREDLGVEEADLLGIPKGRPGEVSQGAILDRALLQVPKGIAEGDFRVLEEELPPLLEGRLPVLGPSEAAIPYLRVLETVEGPLFFKRFSFDDVFHSVRILQPLSSFLCLIRFECYNTARRIIGVAA